MPAFKLPRLLRKELEIPMCSQADNFEFTCEMFYNIHGISADGTGGAQDNYLFSHLSNARFFT
jgi:hypothetical protein